MMQFLKERFKSNSVRDCQNRGALKKEIWVFLRTPLFLGNWCGVVSNFFIQKKEKIKYNFTCLKCSIIID